MQNDIIYKHHIKEKSAKQQEFNSRQQSPRSEK